MKLKKPTALFPRKKEKLKMKSMAWFISIVRMKWKK